MISSGEAEPAKEDFDGDGVYTPHPKYYLEQFGYIFVFIFLLVIVKIFICELSIILSYL